MSRKALWGRLTFGIAAGLLLGELLVRLMTPVMPTSSRWPTVETDIKSKQIADLEDSIDVMFFGSSVTEAAIDPELVTTLTGLDNVYNSSFPFSTPIANEIWLKSVVVEIGVPSVLVIGLPIWPPGTLLALEVESFSSGLEQAVDPPPIQSLSAWSGLVANRGIFANWDLLRQWDISRESGIITDSGHQTGYYDRVASATTAGDFTYSDPSMSARHAGALGRLIETVRSGGGDVILLLEPSRALADPSSDDVTTYIEWLKGQSAVWDVQLWDTYTQGWDDILYADLNHFNRTGTEAFTTAVAERLLDYVSLSS